jgi:GH43 family beta-xylosidase
MKQCEYCSEILIQRDTESNYYFRKRRFCNKSCSNFHCKNGLHNKKLLKTKTCIRCNTEFNLERNEQGKFKERKVCNDCPTNAPGMANYMTKGQLFASRSWQAARSTIVDHARRLYFSCNDNQCNVNECTYTNHIEVAHKKAVKDFSDDTPILDINHIDNLIGLCPNHHWDYDNRLLNL